MAGVEESGSIGRDKIEAQLRTIIKDFRLDRTLFALRKSRGGGTAPTPFTFALGAAIAKIPHISENRATRILNDSGVIFSWSAIDRRARETMSNFNINNRAQALELHIAEMIGDADAASKLVQLADTVVASLPAPLLEKQRGDNYAAANRADPKKR